MVLLIWVYYSAQIFLLGAEFTKVYTERRGSRKKDLKPGTVSSDRPRHWGKAARSRKRAI